MQIEVGSDYVNNLLQQIRSEGGRPDEILAALHIDRNPLGDDRPLDAATYSRLYGEAVRIAQDECFNHFGRRHIPRGTFAMLCDRLLPARDLADALHRASAMQTWMQQLQHRNADFRPQLPYLREGGVAALFFVNQTSSASPVFISQRAIASVLASWHSFLCWLVDLPLPLLEVRLQGRCQLDAEKYARILKAPVRYQQRANSLLIGAQFLQAPVARDRADLREFLALAPYHLVGARARDCDEDSLSNQLRQCLIHGPIDALRGIDSAAARMGLAANDLRHGLEREGCSYQTVRNEARLQMVFAQLRDPTLDLDAIASRNGFDTTPAFVSSFSDWAGLTPQRYRDEVLATPQPA